jgi:hypothetical protein
MGIFYTSSQPVLPTMKEAIRTALTANPNNFANAEAEAANRAVALAQATARTFNPWRFGAALAISAALLCGAIWTGQHGLPDISKNLMNSFSGFSGIVLGLLGGETQKTPTS